MAARVNIGHRKYILVATTTSPLLLRDLDYVPAKKARRRVQGLLSSLNARNSSMFNYC